MTSRQGSTAGGAAADDRAKARARALRYLQERERSRSEVRARLARYGYAPDLVDEVVAWLEEAGLLDQGRFARSLAGARFRAGWSARQVRSELMRKGLIPAEADEALARLAEERVLDGAGDAGGAETEDAADAEEAALVSLVEKRFGRRIAQEGEAAQRRAVSFLLRRGHDWEVARRVVAQVVERGRLP